jgi:hypothetical protein
MNNAAIDFSELKHYSRVFRIYIWLKRTRMIVVRLLLLALLVFIAITFLDGKDHSYSSSGTSIAFDPLFLLIFWFGAKMVLLSSMSASWQKFATKNSFGVQQVLSTSSKMYIPSFRGKHLGMSLFPIVGSVDGRQFGFFTRIYKEGGVLRWRERKMDTIIWYDLPKALPHIVVDSRYNERARRSNMTKHYDKERLIHFEGTTGDKYNVYTGVGNEVAALELFTPSVLDVLFQQLPQLDIEVKDRTIWFVWRYGVLDDRLAANLFSVSSALMAQLDAQVAADTFSEAELQSDI